MQYCQSRKEKIVTNWGDKTEGDKLVLCTGGEVMSVRMVFCFRTPNPRKWGSS